MTDTYERAQLRPAPESFLDPKLINEIAADGVDERRRGLL